MRGGSAKTPDGATIAIDVDPVVVGRDDGAAIRLVDPEVSAIHCELRAVNEGVLVRDLGSTNGTFVGGLRIREAIVTTPSELSVGGSKVAVEPTAKQRVDVGYSDRFGDLVKRVGSTSFEPIDVRVVVLDWIERRLGSYDWPGNVRELVNVAQVAATLAATPEAIDDVLTLARDARGDGGSPLGRSVPRTAFAESKRAAIAAFERDYFTSLARDAGGNVSEMARQSGMERHHVRAYLRKYGIEKG